MSLDLYTTLSRWSDTHSLIELGEVVLGSLVGKEKSDKKQLLEEFSTRINEFIKEHKENFLH